MGSETAHGAAVKAAVRAWRVGDRRTPLVLPTLAGPPSIDDPAEWRDPARRIRAVVRMCASGACAYDIPRRRPVVIDGRTVPPPPERRPQRETATRRSRT